MVKLRLRTKFLLFLLLITFGLTVTSLLIVRQSVNAQIRAEIFEDLRNSVITFQNFKRERETTLSHSAELLADLPTLKALMTTEHPATIQDASMDLWKVAGSNLFVLADRSGQIVALHTDTKGLDWAGAQSSLDNSGPGGRVAQWWYGGGHLYEVFLRPIFFGPPAENNALGVLGVGYEIDVQVAKSVSQISASQVAFFHESSLLVSTLPAQQERELAAEIGPGPTPASKDVQLNGERFLATSVQLTPGRMEGGQLTVLKSYDQATRFLTDLYRILTLVGLLALLSEAILVFLTSRRFTGPLEALVSGVRALERGDAAYPLQAQGSDELAELTLAFDRMRKNLRQTQERLLESERLATIGQMASSISHDLRHRLAAIMANAEFLSDRGVDASQREVLYEEIRLAVNQMTELIDSMLELSRGKDSVFRLYGSIEQTVQRAIHAVQGNPEYHRIRINVLCNGSSEGWFDQKKLERALYNLILNACQAAPRESGKVEVRIRETDQNLEISVSDDGPGIPETIRQRLFEPFVSYGKENGTGLGLTIVQKIAQDHGGTVFVEHGSGPTVFKLILPKLAPSDTIARDNHELLSQATSVPRKLE